MDQQQVPAESVSTVFHRALLWIYVISVLAVIPIIYFFTKQEIYDQADKELKVLVDIVRAARAVVSDQTRPYFLPKGEFFPPVVSSTVMAKEIATRFQVFQPSYMIRMISDNPLNAENRPEGLEVSILESLRKAATDKGVVQVGLVRNRNYLISAAPTKVHDECLICHGNPDQAPAEIVAKYGKASGFGWKPGEIIGASLVGVPVADVNAAVMKRTGIVIGIITALFAGVLLVLNRVVQRSIIQPVQRITAAAEAISLGRSNEALTSDRHDEIGALTRAFELMRRSIDIATSQLARARRPPKQ
jgi:HAMP domain-containing protein